MGVHTLKLCSDYVSQTAVLIEGYGKSPDSEGLKTDQNRVDLLSRFMESLGVRTAVLVSPSMSGHYSIPFLMKNTAQLQGFIPIAPVGTRSYTPQQYQNIQVREEGIVCINVFQNKYMDIIKKQFGGPIDTNYSLGGLVYVTCLFPFIQTLLCLLIPNVNLVYMI